MIGDITAVPEIGRTYLGTVTRLAEFGAFVEIIPGTDGLLHISEVAEHRIKDIKDELKEGDQVLVKVLSVEGNRIKLSRKAILKEQRAKIEAEGGVVAPVTLEGGFEGGDDDEDDSNFNRVDTPNDPPSHTDPRPGGAAGGAGDPRRRRRRSGGGGGPRGPRGPRQ
jgi:polyribonucleotide nucleotidyltransferase